MLLRRNCSSPSQPETLLATHPLLSLPGQPRRAPGPPRRVCLTQQGQLPGVWISRRRCTPPVWCHGTRAPPVLPYVAPSCLKAVRGRSAAGSPRSQVGSPHTLVAAHPGRRISGRRMLVPHWHPCRRTARSGHRAAVAGSPPHSPKVTVGPYSPGPGGRRKLESESDRRTAAATGTAGGGPGSRSPRRPPLPAAHGPRPGPGCRWVTVTVRVRA